MTDNNSDYGILLENVVFAYGADTAPIINIENFRLDKNATLLLEGESGSGKSTLLNLLCGILKADSGKVVVGKQNLSQTSAVKRDLLRAREIGVVFQRFNLVPYLSALDNVLLAISLANKKSPKTAKKDANQPQRMYANELFRAVNLEPQLLQIPTIKLSFGQKQRVGIVRALINRPQLLLLDEPTSALDGKNKDSFMQMLKDCLSISPATVVCVAHDTSLRPHFAHNIALKQINSVS